MAENGADINAEINSGHTSLMCASQHTATRAMWARNARDRLAIHGACSRTLCHMPSRRPHSLAILREIPIGEPSQCLVVFVR